MKYIIPAGTNVYRIHFNKPEFIEYGLRWGKKEERTPIAITEFDILVSVDQVEKSVLPGYDGLTWINLRDKQGVTLLINKKELIKTI